MRVDAGAGPLPAGRQPQASAADRSADASFSAVLAATRAGDAGQADFTRMTRQAMRDWESALSILQRQQEQAMRGRGSVAPGQGGCATDF